MLKNNKTLRIFAMAAACVMALSALCGCSAVIENPVVAEVGDVDILYSQFYNIFETYDSYGIVDRTNSETLAADKLVLMQALVDDALPIAQAHVEGLELTEEEAAEAKASALEDVDNYLENFLDETIEDEAARKQNAIELFDKANKASGYTYERLLGESEASYLADALGAKMKKSVTDAVAEPTEDELHTYYDEQIAQDKASYAENVRNYYMDSSYSISYGEIRPLTVPEGLYYVKHILIKNPDNYTGEDKDRDYKAIAAEVLAKVEAGEDFDALIKEYNEDTGMESNPDGYIFSPEFTDVYDAAFQEAGAKLTENGMTSGLVEGQYGIHIIKRTADIPAEDVPFDEVHDELAESLLKERQNEAYDAKLEEWKANTEIKIYEKRIQYVGLGNE